MTPEERERLLNRAATLQDADLADALLANDDFVNDVLAWQEGSEGDSLAEALPNTAIVNPEHLLNLWAAIDRCATVAADALADEYERTTDFRPNRDGLRERFAAEIWLSVSDAVEWARGDILDGLA